MNFRHNFSPPFKRITFPHTNNKGMGTILPQLHRERVARISIFRFPSWQSRALAVAMLKLRQPCVVFFPILFETPATRRGGDSFA